VEGIHYEPEEMDRIETEEQYEEALREIEALIDLDPEEGTDEANRLEHLAIIIEKYEMENYPIDLMDF